MISDTEGNASGDSSDDDYPMSTGIDLQNRKKLEISILGSASA